MEALIISLISVVLGGMGALIYNKPDKGRQIAILLFIGQILWYCYLNTYRQVEIETTDYMEQRTHDSILPAPSFPNLTSPTLLYKDPLLDSARLYYYSDSSRNMSAKQIVIGFVEDKVKRYIRQAIIQYDQQEAVEVDRLLNYCYVAGYVIITILLLSYFLEDEDDKIMDGQNKRSNASPLQKKSETIS